MQSHQLQKSEGRRHRRVGRGGKRGSFSGRGIKGQKARAGRRIRPQVRDIIKKIHKQRGHGKNAQTVVREKPYILNLGDLERIFSAKGGSASGGKDNILITPKLLIELGLVKKAGGRPPQIKILGGGFYVDKTGKAGKSAKKLTFDKSLLLSASVRAKLGK